MPLAQTPHSANDRPASDGQDGPPESFVSLRDVLGILSRRRRTIFGTMAVLTVLAVAYTLWVGPRYTATALVMIEPQVIAGQRAPVASVIDTERDIIRSPLFIKTTMHDLNLYDVQEYRVPPEDPASLTSRLKGIVKGWLGGSEATETAAPLSPDEAAAAAQKHAREQSESLFADDLSVKQTGESHVLHINFDARVPARAAAVANHIAGLYVQYQTDQRDAAAERAEQWLSARLSQMREDVLTTEQGLAEMRLRYPFNLDRAAARSDGVVRYQDMERQAEAKRAAYEAMLTRYYDSSGRIESLAPKVRLVSSAQPPTMPSSRSPLLIGAMTLAVSAVFGCGLALFREQMDRSIRGKGQMEAALGIPCLGQIPRLDGALQHHGAPAYQIKEPRALYSQAMRSLSLRILAARPFPQVLLVTSALPDEGKSALAASLAVALRQSGDARVLLLDGDFWRPQAGRLFDLPTDTPGLPSVLNDGLPPEDAVVHDTTSGIDILPGDATSPMSNTPSRAAISRLLETLRPTYDHIVIDASSLLGIADARLLALCADSTLLVARWGHTNLDVAGAGLALLRDIGVPVIGTVLTQVDPKQHARHGQDQDLQHYKAVRRYLMP